jgi:F0F1-type ATP synthase assembly protein I
MYDDRHWASDIISGAAIGTFAGIKVVRYNHTRPSNMIDRFFLGSMVEAGSHGDVKAGFSFAY